MRNAVLIIAAFAALGTAGGAISAHPSDNHDILHTAAADPSLTKFVAVAKAAGLEEALGKPGPFTVFVPVDSAFGRLPSGTVAKLLSPEGKADLRGILLDHVVAGRLKSTDLLFKDSVRSAAGRDLEITRENGRVVIGGAVIRKVDIEAENGVIHLIESVIVPPAKPDPVVGVISRAIDTGAPLFNRGNHAACAAAYMIAAEALLMTEPEELTERRSRILSNALAKARRMDDAGDRAWELRRAFDRILMPEKTTMKTAKTETPKPRRPNFKPIVESSMPEGFPQPGPVGRVIVKEYPRYRMARSDGSSSFWTLFNHIKRNKISMTAPVEMTMEATETGMRQIDMAFLYGKRTLGKTGQDGRVKVKDVKPATVLSYGMTGPVTKEKVAAARKAIETRLGTKWVADGDWRMMGYNSPMIPAKMRFYEIQLPVVPAPSPSAD
jgi:uncharacterized surface protein with fasciclin (FAS1) repeats